MVPPRGLTAHTAAGSYTLEGELTPDAAAAVVTAVAPSAWQCLNPTPPPLPPSAPVPVVTPTAPPDTASLDAAVAACRSLKTPAVVQCTTATRAGAVVAAALVGRGGDAAALARAAGFKAGAAAPAQAWLRAWASEGGDGEGGQAAHPPPPPSLFFRQLFDAESSTYTYLLADPATRDAVIIDPVREQAGRDGDLIDDVGLNLIFAINTHVHADHVTGTAALRARFPACKSVISAAAGAVCDVAVEEGDAIIFGRHALRVLATPGHTAGCASYVIDSDPARPGVFTGDALLVRGCGRTDFQSGDAATLYDSVHAKLFALSDAYTVWPAHDYKGRTASSIGEEKAHNPRLGGGRTKEEFVETMASLGLPMPRKIGEAVPANMKCGVE